MPRRPALILTALTGAIVLAVDQLSKAWAQANLQPGHVQHVIGRWIEFYLVRNQGAAFGLFSGQGDILSILVALLLLGMLVLILRGRVTDRLSLVALGAVLGGGLSNLIDRLRSHAVVDFLVVRPWPSVFNVADVAIRAGAILLVIAVLVRGNRRRTMF